MAYSFHMASLTKFLAAGALALSATAPAQAIVYDFKFVGGAQPSLSFASSQLFVDVTQDAAAPASKVLFTFTNGLSEPLSSIVRLYFDTGSNTSLFSGMSVMQTSGTVNFVAATPTTHPFMLGTFTPDFQFQLSSQFPKSQSTYGINPGESATLSATLGAGKSFADVIGALNAGLSSSTGLRVGLFTYDLLGTARNDDAFHVTKSVVAVPEMETWAMMLAGLGLVGLMVSRRRA